MKPLLWISLAVGAFKEALGQNVSPFTFDGPLGGVAATAPAQFNTGGSISVAGISVTIPENLLVQFPAAFVPFRDFAASGAQLGGYEVSVEGNYVGGTPIAGRVFVSQLIGGAGAGIVDRVNTDGTLTIVGGPTLRINTPSGIYAVAYDKNPFFTSDEQNPSISSFSGYPMCVPRSAADNDCPSNNRAANGDRVYKPTNTSAMAPFLPGDFVTWAGITNGPEILVYSLVAENVQQTTSGDSGDPVYVRVEDALIGINDGTQNVEFAQNRFTGYLSDGTASVEVYRLDIDPCTGQENMVLIRPAEPPKAGARNKFDIRFSDAAVSTASREYRIKATKGLKTVAKAIQAGQYVAPISEVIWPENNVPGTAITQNAFNLFGQLKDGFVFDNQQWGQLKPWPGSPAPAPAKTCTGSELSGASDPQASNTAGSTPAPAGQTPVANAGNALIDQLAGSLISITGQNTNANLASSQLSFAWTGPAGITITNANTAKMSFVNPWPTTIPGKNTFTLKICLVSDQNTCSTSAVDVTTSKTEDTVTITGYQFINRQGGTISVSATSNNLLRGTNGANLQVQLSGTGNFITMTQDVTNPGLYTYNARSIGNQPSRVTVKSSKNPTPVVTTTFI